MTFSQDSLLEKTSDPPIKRATHLNSAASIGHQRVTIRKKINVSTYFDDIKSFSDQGRLELEQISTSNISTQSRGGIVTQPIKIWAGYVVKITADSFFAHLRDHNDTEPEIIVEFLHCEISPGDRSLLNEGAVFYWIIYHTISRNGQRRGEKEIRFRRLSMTAEEEQRINDEIRDLESTGDLSASQIRSHDPA